MKVARVDWKGKPCAAIVEPDGAKVCSPDEDVLTLLTDPDARSRAAAGADGIVALSELSFLPPIQPATFRDFSVFEQHIEGAIKTAGGADAPVPEAWYERPVAYFSNPHGVSGPGAAIQVPPGCEAMDLELEVAVVIGRSGRDLSPEDADAYIAGYTIWNDWSARDLGGLDMRLPFGQFKGKDFANTIGPWIVTPDELEPYRVGDRLDLDMRAAVNGNELGSDTLANMAWSFPELVAYSSKGAWIGPGDVIGSGTCGFGCLLEFWGHSGRREPPPLTPGDTVTLTVEGIGTLENHIVEGTPSVVEWSPARPGRLRHRAAVGEVR
jgi:2-keto-4-pentenoate hydratase/2-oxohepta-3-ene-1,7-dioic acid hydratase in catechol pathway